MSVFAFWPRADGTYVAAVVKPMGKHRSGSLDELVDPRMGFELGGLVRHGLHSLSDQVQWRTGSPVLRMTRAVRFPEA